jgi:hypothetical protein
MHPCARSLTPDHALCYLYSVKAYFAVNSTIYDTEQKKVITALAYIMKVLEPGLKLSMVKPMERADLPTSAHSKTLRKNSNCFHSSRQKASCSQQD